MKTNHRRGFVDSRDYKKDQRQFATCFERGHVGAAYYKRGMKRRQRRLERRILNREEVEQ